MTLLREQETQNKDLGIRCFTGNIRAIEDPESGEEENERRFLLSFSSEDPYRRWFGIEILDHSEGAMDLTRLNEIGVLLFNHDTDKVVGKIIKAWLEEGRCYAEVEFDSDDAAEIIFQKVKGGTLKATSVRYAVNIWEELEDGVTSKDGKYKGPCWIARDWTPLEVSIVSVPADATVGVGRDYQAPVPTVQTTSEADPIEQVERGRSINELQLLLNKSSNP